VSGYAPRRARLSGTAGLARRLDDKIPMTEEVATMQYLLMLTFAQGEGPQEGTPEFDREMEAWGKLNEELRAAGVVIGASGLEVDAATTVRAPGGDVTITDGPYAETKEVLFSFYMLDVEDLDAAAAWAAKMPAAEYGSITIQPMVGYEGRRGVPDRPGAWLTTTAWRAAFARAIELSGNAAERSALERRRRPDAF
jgi:hypothetical protein